jgi:hypothetical protein
MMRLILRDQNWRLINFMEIDQQEDFDEDFFAGQGIDQKEDFGDDSFAEQGIEQNGGFVAEEMVYHSARVEEIPIHDGLDDLLRWGIRRICSNPIELWVLFNILNLRRMEICGINVETIWCG